MNQLYILIWAICDTYKDESDDFIVSTGHQEMVHNPFIGQALPEIQARISDKLGNYRASLAELEKIKYTFN